MPAGQSCAVCGATGHNRRTCPSEIADVVRAIDADLDRIEESLASRRPRTAAQQIREHMAVLVGDRDEALVRAETAEQHAADLEIRVAELTAANAELQEINGALWQQVTRLRHRASTVVERMRASA